jgi:monofunctional biosynthetic peptidoglycan transglycosylase
MRPRGRPIGRFVVLLLISLGALQLYFVGRIALMRVADPQSTTFQRSEAWRLAFQPGEHLWRQRWVDYPAISVNLKRAVVAAEDSGFTEHSGVEWDAIEKAWGRNDRAAASAQTRTARPAKVVGGSTITQQLAKNLFLGGERNFVRKAQELVLSWELEAMLGKQRILEVYLNSVEWGEGVFGADAAAKRYFGVGANGLAATQAAQLAVMLPAPKRFEKRPGSAYVAGRAATVVARMGHVDVP